MRLEYNKEQERQLRITEIESVLDNHLAETKVDELSLEVELQFLEGNTNVYGEPIAYIKLDNGNQLEITLDENIEQYSMLIYDKEGNPNRLYYNANTLEALFEEVLEDN